MEVMSPCKSKIIPFTPSSGIRRKGMWCRGGNQKHHQGLGVVKLLLRKLQPLPRRRERWKIQGPSSAVLKAEDKAWFPFEEFLLLLEPIPSREVTGGHGSSVCTGNFLLPSLIPDAPNKRGRGTSTENWVGKGFLSLERFSFLHRIF